MDVALENAIARAKATRARIDAMQEEISGLIAARDRAVADLNSIRQFVDTWYEMAGIPNPYEEQNMDTGPAITRRVKNPDRERVADVALALIEQARRPLTRRELFEALPAYGIVLNGKDPEMVLSTMLWRSKSKIVRLPGFGYWPADQDYMPANYVQFGGVELLGSAAANEPEDGIEADDVE